MIPNRTIGASSESLEKVEQLVGVDSIHNRTRIHSMRDLMAKLHRKREPMNRLSVGAILPAPRMVYILQSEGVGHQETDIFGVGSVEATELPSYGRIECGPESKRW